MNRTPHQLQLLKQARNTGERRMIECALNADRNAPNWTDRAHWALAQYTANQPNPFTAEDAREYMEATGLLDPPHDGRAYGAVFKRAIRLQVIKPVGYAPTVSGHGHPMPLYVRKPREVAL